MTGCKVCLSPSPWDRRLYAATSNVTLDESQGMWIVKRRCVVDGKTPGEKKQKLRFVGMEGGTSGPRANCWPEARSPKARVSRVEVVFVPSSWYTCASGCYARVNELQRGSDLP